MGVGGRDPGKAKTLVGGGVSKDGVREGFCREAGGGDACALRLGTEALDGSRAPSKHKGPLGLGERLICFL